MRILPSRVIPMDAILTFSFVPGITDKTSNVGC